MDDDDFDAGAASPWTIPVGTQAVTMDALVEHWLRPPVTAGPEGEALARLRRIFVDGGVEALHHATRSRGWVQLGLRPGASERRGRMYADLAELSRALLHAGHARNAFFMHKEPGLRVRFELGDEDHAGLTERVRAGLEPAVRSGAIAAIQPGVYEPETRLFGGPRSMEHVHRLFTPDALLWLDYHALARSEPDSTWALSFVVLRALFTALRIADWEDIDVWERVRSRAGRRLPPEAASLGALAGLCLEVREAWLDPAGPWAALPEPLGALGRMAAHAIADEATRWREQYFARDGARLGARAGAALFVIFHWNRAGLSPTRQALLAEALAGRATV